MALTEKTKGQIALLYMVLYIDTNRELYLKNLGEISVKAKLNPLKQTEIYNSTIKEDISLLLDDEDARETAIRWLKWEVRLREENPLSEKIRENLIITLEAINRTFDMTYSLDEAREFVREILHEIVDENLQFQTT